MSLETDLIGIGGNILGPVLSYVGGRESRATQEELFDRSLEFTERMSSTAVQRHTKDMRSAGLNPILAAGGQASTPGASAYQPENLLGNAVTSAKEIARNTAEMKSVNAGTKKTNASTKLIESQNAIAQKEVFMKGIHLRLMQKLMNAGKGFSFPGMTYGTPKPHERRPEKP